MEIVNSACLYIRGVVNLLLGLSLVLLSTVILGNNLNGARDVLANFIFGFGLLYITLSLMGALRAVGIIDIAGLETSSILFIPMAFTVYCIYQCRAWVRRREGK